MDTVYREDIVLCEGVYRNMALHTFERGIAHRGGGGMTEDSLASSTGLSSRLSPRGPPDSKSIERPEEQQSVAEPAGPGATTGTVGPRSAPLPPRRTFRGTRAHPPSRLQIPPVPVQPRLEVPILLVHWPTPR